MPWDKHRHKRMDSQISRHSRLYSCFLKRYRHKRRNNAGYYRGTQKACTGHGKLCEGVSLLDDTIHSNTAALSMERLGGQAATISHHLSADLQATHNSLQGSSHATVLNSCLIPSLLPSSALCLTSSFLCLSPPHCVFICSWADWLWRCSLGSDLDAVIGSELVSRLILFRMKLPSF